jgi:predicted nuclease with TOPRIM domain
MQNSRRAKTIFNSVFSTQANEENSKKRLVELQESLDAAKKEKNQLIQESKEAKTKLRNEMDLLKQRMEQLVDEGADKQEKIDRLEAKRNELIAQVWSSYQRVFFKYAK